MDLLELQQRIAKWENLHTEFKSRPLPLRANIIAKALVAFANTDGGQLIIGVDDKNHQITGVDDIYSYPHCQDHKMGILRFVY